MKKNQETKAFSQILDIIRTHRAGALASVNIEHLLSRWEIGAYISAKIKHDGWGHATIDRLVDYIHANAPDERGYGRRNLYNMVSVYEAFTSPEFTALVLKYGDSIVQSATGQIVQTATAQMPPVGRCIALQKRRPQHGGVCAFPYDEPCDGRRVQACNDSARGTARDF